MGELKRLSPQAEQYYSILSSFHQAIKAYKEQLHREKRPSRANLVDRVFLPDMAPDFDGPEFITTQLPSPDLTVLDSSSVEWPNELSLDALDDMVPIDPALIGNNDVIMRMLWESDRYAMDYSDCMLPDADMSLEPPIQV